MQQLTNCSHCGTFSLPSQPRLSLLFQRVEVRSPIDGGMAIDRGVVTGFVWDECLNDWSYQVTFPDGMTSAPWMPHGFAEVIPGDEVFEIG